MGQDNFPGKIYQVGGCVRDEMLGIRPKDVDYVIVGATEQDVNYFMPDYKKVAAAFPVFLSPAGEEYALARTEKKSGDKYTDFTVSTAGVTLEQDLMRRDLTINAMARDVDGTLHDPYNGRQDLIDKTFRHVNAESFKEDPLRVLRIGRFLARHGDWAVGKETFELCAEMCAAGMLQHLTPERVSLELSKSLLEPHTSRFFMFLRMVGGLKDTFPEIYNLIDVPQPYKYHPEGDVFLHTMMVVDQASAQPMFDQAEKQMLVFCALTHDLGKAVSPPDNYPHHYGHEAAGVPIIHDMCERLRMPNVYRDHAKMVARYHTHIHNFHTLKASTIVKMFTHLKVNQNQMIIRILPLTSQCDSRGRTSMFANVRYPNASTAINVMQALTKIRARDVCTEEELKNVNIIKNRLEHAMISLVEKLR